MEQLLISIDDFQSIVGLSNTFDEDYIEPMISQATDITTERILGTALTEKIKTDYNSESLTGLYGELYDSPKCSLKKMICWETYVLCLPRMAIQIQNGGVVRASGSNSQEAASNADLTMLMERGSSSVVFHENRVKKFLSTNYNDIPELKDDTPDYLKPNTEESDNTKGLGFSPNFKFDNF